MEAVWFTTHDEYLIGIVIKRFENPRDSVDTKSPFLREAYIGIGKGGNRQKDIEHVQKTGAKFPLSEALRLMG